jgi:hypothetical protein
LKPAPFFTAIPEEIETADSMTSLPPMTNEEEDTDTDVVHHALVHILITTIMMEVIVRITVEIQNIDLIKILQESNPHPRVSMRRKPSMTQDKSDDTGAGPQEKIVTQSCEFNVRIRMSLGIEPTLGAGSGVSTVHSCSAAALEQDIRGILVEWRTAEDRKRSSDLQQRQ